MQHTTRSSALGGIMGGSGIRTDPTPGSAESWSMPAGIASVVGATDATTIWIEQVRRLPHMTPIARSTSETPSSARSVTTPDGFLAAGHDPAAGGPGVGAVSLYTSTDGETWSRVPDFPIGSSSGPGRIRVVGESLVIDGQLSDAVMVDGQLVPTGTYPIAVAWRSADVGKTWESISLALPEGAVGSPVETVVQGSKGLVFLGSGVTEDGHGIPEMWVEH